MTTPTNEDACRTSVTEWGVLLPWGAVDTPYTEEKARARVAEGIDGSTLVRREVTEWAEVTA